VRLVLRKTCLLAVVTAAAACQRTPPLDSCRDPLSGVWLARSDTPVPAAPLRGDERLGFDVRDERGSIAIYPLWDSSRPAGGKTAAMQLSPWRITLTRAGDAAVGTISWRVTQDGQVCTVKQPARLSACQNQGARLELTLAETISPSSCAVASPPTRRSFTLTRQ
jgi:hypothetical protein